MIRVILVDDHPPFRMGMRVLLEQHADICVIGEADSGTAALTHVEQFSDRAVPADATAEGAPGDEAAHQPAQNVLVLDCQLPDRDGPSIASEIQQRALPIHILALSAYSDADYVRGMLAAGAIGYLLKNEAPETIVTAVRAAASGKAYFSASVSMQLASLARNEDAPEASLIQRPTEREMDVLRLLVTGQTNAQIARKLSISERTVRFHMENLFTRLNVDNRTEAVVTAIAQGWLDVKGTPS